MFTTFVGKPEMRNIKNMNMKTRCFFLAVALSLTGSAAFAQQSEEGAQVQVKDQDAEVGRVSISPYAVKRQQLAQLFLPWGRNVALERIICFNSFDRFLNESFGG